jgi:ATP-dependent DNA ligase
MAGTQPAIGDDLRREQLEVCKATLASVLAKAGSGLRLNEHLEHDDGEVVFRHACKIGLEGSHRMRPL